jgi:hypothetical protein
MVFTVKAHADGTPWIACEPLSGSLSILKKGILGFDLPDGCTHQQAEQIAARLNNNIKNVTYTPIPGW